MPKSPWSATGEAGALRLERSLCSSNEDSVLPKKKNHSRSQETKACQSSVSCALSLGVEGGDAGEKGEPV